MYISHSVSNELINAKNKKVEYNIPIDPNDLLKFFKMFQIDINSIEKNKLSEEQFIPSPNNLNKNHS